MFCMDRYSCTLGDILYSTKIEDMIHSFVSRHISEIHMSEADLLWECIAIIGGWRVSQGLPFLS